MNEGTEIKLENLARLDLQPGDVLVYRSGQPLPVAARDHIARTIGAALAREDIRVLVLDDGAELSVLRPAHQSTEAGEVVGV